MNQYGSLWMVPEWESVQCMNKVRAGTHVNSGHWPQRSWILQDPTELVTEADKMVLLQLQYHPCRWYTKSGSRQFVTLLWIWYYWGLLSFTPWSQFKVFSILIGNRGIGAIFWCVRGLFWCRLFDLSIVLSSWSNLILLVFKWHQIFLLFFFSFKYKPHM